jgi:predicted nuclease of predicted toxin-antitoxin system
MGPATATDQEICEHAREHGYVVVTNDLDFPLILAHTRRARPSVILLRGEPLVPEARGDAFLRALQECRAELDRGAIVSLDWSDRPRARVLPLR